MDIKRYALEPLMSRVVEFHHAIFVAGLTADDRSADIKEQTRQVFAKIDKYLAMAGTDKSRLLSATIFLKDIKHRPQLDEDWTAWVDSAHPPTRSCIGAQLVEGALVEIMVTAYDRS